MRIASLIFFIVLWSESFANTIFKCNIDGKIVYTDKECEGEVVNLKLTNRISSEGTEGLYNNSRWYSNYKGYTEALELSKKIKVPVFLYFQADWCGYCRQLERELLSTPRGEVTLRRIIKVNISPEHGDDEALLFEQLGGTGFPSIFIQKGSDSTSYELRFMEKVDNKWQTKPASYLAKTIDLSLKKGNSSHD